MIRKRKKFQRKQKIKELLDEIAKLKNVGGNADERVKQLEKDVANLKAKLEKQEKSYETLQSAKNVVDVSEKKIENIKL